MDNGRVGEMMAAYSMDAVDHAKRHFRVDLDYSPDSVREVETILGRLQATIPRGVARLFRRGPSRQVIETFAKMYGGYVGEVFRRTHGGEWELRTGIPGTDGPVISFVAHGGDTFFPPARVFKRLTGGEDESVWTYFTVLEGRGQDHAV